MAAESDAEVVTQNVSANGGALSVTISTSPTFDPLNYSNSAQNPTSAMQITIDDARATGAGWAVSAVVTAASAPAGVTFDESNFSFTDIADPVRTAGQDVTGLEKGVDGTLETSRSLLTAEANDGQGTYTQGLTLGIDIPAFAKAGDYSGTLTITTIVGV